MKKLALILMLMCFVPGCGDPDYQNGHVHDTEIEGPYCKYLLNPDD